MAVPIMEKAAPMRTTQPKTSSRQRRQRMHEIPDARYLVHGAADHVVVQRRMRVDAPRWRRRRVISSQSS